MNSAPIALRLASGSLSPDRRSRKRSSASTATSGTLKWSRKAAITWSPSFLRISPWSTNTHVSRSPTARCTSRAATDESTPPDSPADHAPITDLGADRRDLLVDDRGGLQSRAAAHVLEEGGEDLLAVRRVHDLGVELDAVQARARHPPPRRPATRSTRRAAEKPGGASYPGVAVRHPARCSAGVPASRRPGSSRSRSSARTPHLGALDAAAESEHQSLHAVADAEHRDASSSSARSRPARLGA